MSTFTEQFYEIRDKKTELEKIKSENKQLKTSLNYACEKIFEMMNCEDCKYRNKFTDKLNPNCNVCNFNKIEVIETIKNELLNKGGNIET